MLRYLDVHLQVACSINQLVDCVNVSQIQQLEPTLDDRQYIPKEYVSMYIDLTSCIVLLFLDRFQATIVETNLTMK